MLLLCQSRAQGCHREVLFSDRNVCQEWQEKWPPRTSFSPTATTSRHRLPLKSLQNLRCQQRPVSHSPMRRGKLVLSLGLKKPHSVLSQLCSKAKTSPTCQDGNLGQPTLHPHLHVEKPVLLLCHMWGASTGTSAGRPALGTGSDGFIFKAPFKHTHTRFICIRTHTWGKCLHTYTHTL